jgi:Cu/Ag efflux pump CusA
VAGRDIRGAYDDARRAITAQVALPAGVRIEYAGQFEREEATGRRLLFLGLLAILGIGLIVGATLGSVRRTLIVLVNLPLALAGGVIGVYLAGGVLSVATTIGFITLFGIATRNGILLATRARDLEVAGTVRHEAVARAARERLAPILMTAVTAALGLLPLALALGRPGSEIQAPMALVILTGLATSTALNMVAVPALLARWGGPATGKTPPA